MRGDISTLAQQQQEEQEAKPKSKSQANKQGTSRGETRRVQLTGGSTLIVSLPREWAKSVGLGAKDEVHLVPQADMSLLVVSGGLPEKTAEKTIDITPSMDDGEILRTFIAYYVAGFDVVRLRFRGTHSEIRTKVKTLIRQKLIGVEIVEETTETILTQSLHGHVDLPLKKALDRMAIITSSMQLDSVKSLSTADTSFAKEIIERDDEVDRFSHFIVRQLNLAIHNRMMIEEIGLGSAQDCMSYRMIVKSIERIADHGAQVASCTIALDRRKVPQMLLEHILKLSKLSNDVYENALRAVHSRSGKIANETIGKLRHVTREEGLATEELISSRLDNNAVAFLRLALESLRRIAEYSTDICEIVVNMTVGSPL